MVLYFSGTGNSRYAAEAIAELIGDETADMKAMIRKGTHKRLYSEKPYVICAPIYAWRFPRIVESFIKKSDFWGSREIYFVATCYSQTGTAGLPLKRIADQKGLKFMGFSSVAMPENYIVMFDAPTPEEEEKIFPAADREIASIAKRIRAGKRIFNRRVMLLGFSCTVIGNPLFYSFIVKSEKFRLTDACTGCGKCAAVCPMKCIKMRGGRPVWTKKCTHCMACINQCPALAIEYGKSTVDRARYVCGRKFDKNSLPERYRE